MNIPKIVIAATAVVVTGFFLRGCSSGDEGQIRKQLSDLEELVSFEAGEGNLSSLTKVKRLGGLFTEDVSVEFKGLGVRVRTVNGREQIQQAALAARKQVSGLDAVLYDVTVDLTDDQRSAIVEATGRAKIAGEGRSEVQDFLFTFKRTDEGWLIAEVTTVQALR